MTSSLSCMLTQKPCQHDCEYGPDDPCKLMERFTKIFRRLNSDSDIELCVSVRAMRRVLTTENLDFNDVATAIERRRYNREDVDVVFARGKEVASREVATQNPELEFFDIDGNPNWYAIAKHNRDNIDRLRKDWDKEFTNDMVAKVIMYEPSPKQAKNILRIFVQLGGRLDPRLQAIYF
jgi:hypothetical protein